MLLYRLFHLLSVLFYLFPFRNVNCIKGFKGTDDNESLINNISIETQEEKNTDPLSKIVGNFVDMTEEFWKETDVHLNEYRKRRLIPGPWWLAEVREDYESLKSKFHSSLPSDIPKVCLDIMSDYEIRYNAIMYDQLENEILRIGRTGYDAKENSICITDILEQNEFKEESNDTLHSEGSEIYEVSVKPNYEGLFLADKNITQILSQNETKRTRVDLE